LIGNSIELNNLSNKIVIAEDNGDNRLKHYIIGRVFYRLMDFDPIEEKSLKEELPYVRIYKLLELLILISKLQTKSINYPAMVKIKEDNKMISDW